MEVVLTPSQETLLDQAVREGRVANREDGVRVALSLWEQAELERKEMLEMIAEGEAQLDSGDYIELANEEELHEFMEDVIRRGKERFEAEAASRRK